MTNRFTRIMIAGLLATAGVASFAQTTPMHEGDMHQGMMGHRMDPAKMEAMVAKHLAELKTSLKITADQEGAWTTFAAAMKPLAMDHKRPDRSEIDKLTTPERIDKMRTLRAEHMAQRTAAMEKREDAVKAFYATLNADQKKTFDAAHTKMMHHTDKRHHAS